MSSNGWPVETALPGVRSWMLVTMPLCGELVGLGRRALEQAVAYAREREQFGRPIGAFQAVAHRCAEMFMNVAVAEILTRRAAWAADAAQADLAEREQRLSERAARVSELEQESAGYQDQILKAYQRIKSDESIVSRAKKALAIALTLLDESAKDGGDEAKS